MTLLEDRLIDSVVGRGEVSRADHDPILRLPLEREITAGTHVERMPRGNKGRDQCSIKNRKGKDCQLASRHVQRPGAESREEPELGNEGFLLFKPSSR